nr:hypothetical protein [Tanacetum cinerariifolium]
FDQTQPPQFPVIHLPPQEISIEVLHDQENAINSVQTFLRKFNCYSFFETPKVLLLAWDRVFKIKDAFGNKQYKPEDIQELFCKLFNDVQNIHEELAEYINTTGWNRPAFYNNGDDDDVDYTIAITPVLSTEEPDNSLNNPTPSFEFLTKSSSTSPKSFLEETNTFDNSLPEFENFFFDLEEISSGSTTTHFDISLPDCKAFYFYDDHIEEISSGSTTTHSDISLPDCKAFYFYDDHIEEISSGKYDCFYFRNLPDPGEWISILNFGICENLSSTTRVNLPVEDDHFPLLAYVVWIILAYLTYPVTPPYLHSFGNEDTIFDPGIAINRFYSFKPGLSHRGGTFKKFNTHLVQYSRKLEDFCQMILSSKSSFPQLQLGIILLHLAGSQPMLKSSYKVEAGVIISIPSLVGGVADVVVEIKGTGLQESTSDDAQNRNPSVTKTEASPSTISSKPFIKKPSKSSSIRGNQRNWNNLKSQQLGVKMGRSSLKNNYTYRSMPSKHAIHKPHRPPIRPMRPNMTAAHPNRTSLYKPAHSYSKRPFQRTSALRSTFRAPWVPTVIKNFLTVNRKFHTVNRKFPTGSTKFFTADMKIKGNAVQASACWIWKPSTTNKGPNSNSVSMMFKKYTYIDAQGRLNGCSRHITGNISYLSDYEPFDGGYVSFGQGGCKITGKGTIKTGKLEFENVYFMKDLKYNLFSMSQICDNKNSVLFTDSKCIVLGRDFKLLDDANAFADEGMMWHMRLGHLNFKTMNRLVRHNLVRGLPFKCFENDHTSTSCKAKLVNSVTKPLHTLHMDLFGPTSISSISHKWYCLVVADDFSRCDNGGKFRNKEMDAFCSQKGIKREFSNARTPQQNGVVERRNKTVIEAARTMLADAKLPVTFWAKAVNTACYVQNKVLVNKSHNKTPYELFNGRTPAIGFLKPFGCHVMILNTLDHLRKFEPKRDEGFFIGYSMSSKVFMVFNKRTKRVEENLHVDFLENKAIEKGVGLNWLFDIDSLTKSINYVPMVVAGTNSTNFLGTKDAAVQEVKKDISSLRYIALPNWVHNALLESSSSNAQDTSKANASESNGNPNPTASTTNPPADQMETPTAETPIPTVSSHILIACFEDSPKPSTTTRIISKRVTSQDEIPSLDTISTLANRFDDIFGVTTNTVDSDGVEADVLKNKKDERGIVIRNKARLVAQGHTQEEKIDYNEVFAPVDPEFPARVYKVEKAMYGLHHAPRAWYGTKDSASQEVKKDVSSLRYIALPNWVHDALLESSSSNAQDTCKVNAPESSRHPNPTATSTNLLADQLETLIVETPIPTVSLPVPTAFLNDSPAPSNESNGVEADVSNMETTIIASPTLTLRIHKDHPKSQIIGPVDTLIQTRNKSKEKQSHASGSRAYTGGRVDYDEVFAPVAKIEAIRLFLAYASFMGFTVYQMDVKSAFLYDTIDEEVLLEPGMGKDGTGKDVDLHLYRSMIGSLMYLTASRPDIMFASCAYARHQVTPKECHLHAVKRIFRYLKGHPKLGLWYPKESPFDLVAYSDSDYGGATHDRKLTTRGCQFLGRRLISWQCKKQTIMATSTTEAEYVAAARMFQYLVDRNNEDGTKILVTVDGKLRTVFESSIRRNLKLNDEAGFSSLPDAELFENLQLMGYNILYTPMVEKSKLDEDPKGKAIDPTHYRRMVGTLMYLTASRPDLTFAVCMYARYQLANIFTKALGRGRIEIFINKLGMRIFMPETLKRLADEAKE